MKKEYRKMSFMAAVAFAMATLPTPAVATIEPTTTSSQQGRTAAPNPGATVAMSETASAAVGRQPSPVSTGLLGMAVLGSYLLGIASLASFIRDRRRGIARSPREARYPLLVGVAALGVATTMVVGLAVA